MEQRKPPEYILAVFADVNCVKDIVKGILHTIFFHRYFPSIRPSTTEVLDLTLPYINDVELETLIDTRVSTLIHQLSSSTNAPNGGPRAQIAVQFFEKRRRKSAWFGGLGGNRGDEEICWEVWSLDVTIATPKTEADRAKVRKAMENMLQKTAIKIVTIVNREKDHIPPITTSDTNPFPYQIVLNPKQEGWSNRLGLY